MAKSGIEPKLTDHETVVRSLYTISLIYFTISLIYFVQKNKPLLLYTFPNQKMSLHSFYNFTLCLHFVKCSNCIMG